MNTVQSALLFLSDHPWLFALAKGSLMLAVVGGVFAIALKLRLSAAARHGLLLAGCIAALAVPLLALAPAMWRVGVAVEAQVEAAMPTPPAMPTFRPEPKAEPRLVVAPEALPVSAVAQVAPATPAWHLPSPVQLALWLWLCGAAVVLMPLAVAYLRLLMQATRARTPVCPEWAQWLAEEAARAGVRHPVGLCVLPTTGLAPATFGFGRFSRIVLPQAAQGWSETDLRLVLAHELAHVRRCDWLARLAGQLMLAVYWFNPLAWWAAWRMGAEAEFACDERVVAGGARASAYAQCMVDMAARMSRVGGGCMAPAMPFGSFLSRRVVMVLEDSGKRRGLGRGWAWGLALGAGVMACGVGCAGVEKKEAQVAPVKKMETNAIVKSDENQKWLESTRKAAEQGDPWAQLNLGGYYDGGGAPKDPAKAAEWYGKAVASYRKGAEQGDAKAQMGLGSCYEHGDGVAEDKTQAVKWYLKAAEQGNADAQHALGNCYGMGSGVPESFAQAAGWYRKAADQGLDASQWALADCYAHGRGVPKDSVKAAQWYRKAADQGLAMAQVAVGVCYAHGEGVPKDQIQAVAWYLKAAENENPGQNAMDAPLILSVCCADGNGVPQDAAKAAEWYNKAVAMDGDGAAQARLAELYAEGKSIPKDQAKAMVCWRKAVAEGYQGWGPSFAKTDDPVAAAPLLPSETQLFDAAKSGDLETVKRLLASGVKSDIKNESGNQPIHWAARMGRTEVVRLLLNSGAKVDVIGQAGTPLAEAAAGQGHADTIKLLLQAGAKWR